MAKLITLAKLREEIDALVTVDPTAANSQVFLQTSAGIAACTGVRMGYSGFFLEGADDCPVESVQVQNKD